MKSNLRNWLIAAAVIAIITDLTTLYINLKAIKK
jgi:hypothetical protein